MQYYQLRAGVDESPINNSNIFSMVYTRIETLVCETAPNMDSEMNEIDSE